MQVFQENPGFGALFGQGLGEGLQTSFQKYFEQKENKKQLQGLWPVFERLNVPKEGFQQMIDAGLSVKDVVPFAELLQKNYANEQTKREAQQEQEKTQEIFDKSSRELNRGLLGKPFDPANIGSPTDVPPWLSAFGPLASAFKSAPSLNPESRESRNYFDTLAARYEGQLVKLVSGNKLSDQRFRYIIDNLLPSSKLNDRANKGRLRAIADELGLSQAELLNGKTPKESKKASFKAEEKGQLSREQATKFLREAKGDKEEARRLARESGYEF